MIFENDGEEDFFEIELTEQEVDRINRNLGVTVEIPYGIKQLRIFVCKKEEV